ncbi:T9SS type A sorting domain-containing protein [Rubrivirga sp. IMCC43871]|uniref:golvesin C-terminal-like domain-containing protein n=1 Tax=Rubrivirga sp. IMCC43871 TaxID=3391575 RepID=UPI0039903629
MTRHLAGLALLLLASAAHAQGSVSFVLGSDTSTPGISVDRRAGYYPNGNHDLFLSPTGNAARAMAPAFRAAHTDSYGDPLRLTWWMQNGSLYRDAVNTNVPLPSTMSTYLMRTAWGDAIEAAGDEFTFHYHTWVWNDDDGDGRYRWNQARAFTDEVRDDFDQTIADGLLMDGMYPASFRSGWHFMDDAWQAHLDTRLPFSLHNDAPHVHDDRVEPIDNLYDWSRAPLAFVPFRPSAEDYQRPGGTGGWNVRSRSFAGVTEALVRGIFEAAVAGEDQVACIWDHLADPTFVERLEATLGVIERVAAEYPGVPFRYETGTAAMQRWLGTDDREPPTLTLDVLSDGRYRITSDEPLFQDGPFVAVLDRYERRRILPVVPAGPLAWETVDPVAPALVARVAAAASDSAGNVATRFLRPLPDDLVLDDAEAGYAEAGPGWQPLAADHVWGRTARAAVLAEGADAAARWTFTVDRAGRRHAFVRMPEAPGAAADVKVAVSVGGAEAAAVTFDAPPPVNAWLFVGAVDVDAGDAVTVEVRASGDGQPGARLGADAVKLSALIRDRQLLAPTALDLGEAIFHQQTTATVPLRNLGTEPLTVHAATTASGAVRAAEGGPFEIAPMGEMALPLVLSADAPGVVRDTLVVASDDPTAPERRVPVEVEFLDTFVLVDDADPGYAERGDWRTSSAEAYGPTSRFAFLASAPQATFAFTAPDAGVYAVETIVPASTNAVLRADYAVRVGGQTRLQTQADQRGGDNRWRVVGTLALDAGDAVEVAVSATPDGQADRVLRADAARLLRLGDALAEVVLDDADAAVYHDTGAWQTSVTQAVGATSRYVPFGGDPTATFETTAVRSGPHLVSFIVPETANASRQARYRILRNGAPLGEVTVDQNEGSGAWQSLGGWSVHAGDRLAVEVHNAETSNSARVLRADAVRIAYAVATGRASAPGPALALGPLVPNPAQGPARVALTLGAAADVRVEVFDVLGRRVAVLADGPLAAGTHEVAVDVTAWAAGVYVCRVRAGDAAVTRRWTVAR